jgi:hypothetical protein
MNWTYQVDIGHNTSTENTQQTMLLKIIGSRVYNIASNETSCLYNYRSFGNTKIGHSINANNFLLVKILMPTFAPILQRNNYASKGGTSSERFNLNFFL